jgi:hypothetical protein
VAWMNERTGTCMDRRRRYQAEGCDAVQNMGDKDWEAISALVPGRTRAQCRKIWQNESGFHHAVWSRRRPRTRALG